MDPTQIKPYVDLLTWQVVATLGGALFLPAIYLFVFRLSSVAIGDMKAELTQKQAKQIDNEVAQDAADDEAEGVAKPEKVAESIEVLADEEAENKKEMYKNIVQAWTNLSIILQALALPHGGAKNLKSFVKNVELLRQKNVIPREECTRLQYLHEQRFHLRDHPAELTQESYRSYIRRASRLANRLTKGTAGLKSFGTLPANASTPEARPN